MTDRSSGPESENLDDIYAVPEGGEGEAWQGDLPPADDFHDDMGGVSMDENGMDPDEASAASQPMPDQNDEAKKRGRRVLFSIIGVMGLFGAGIAYLNFSGDAPVSGPSPMMAVLGNSPKAKVEAPANKSAGDDVDLLAPRTGETDLSSLYKGGGQADSSSVALPSSTPAEAGKPADKAAMLAEAERAAAASRVVDDVPLVSNDPGIPAPTGQASAQRDMALFGAAPQSAKVDKEIENLTAMPGLNDGVPGVAPAKTEPPKAVMPAVAPAPVVLPAQVQAPAAPAPQIASTVAPAVDGGSAARVEQLTKDLTALKASLEQSTQHVADLTRRLDQSTAAEQAARQELQSVKQQASRHAAAGVSIAEPAGYMGEEEKPIKRAPSARVKPSVAKAKKAASRTTSPRHGWVLRAATPDMAWVSKGANSEDLERVFIGDSLEGIGQIKDIRQKGDRWELVGSKGSVR